MNVNAENIDGAAWRVDPVVVRDYTHDGWRPHVRAIVDEFNASMPENVPILRYEAMPVTGQCDALIDAAMPGVLAVCDVGIEALHASGTAWRDTPQGGRVTHAAVVSLKPWGDGWAYPSQLLCHEFMHVVTGIPDARPPELAEVSCVQGSREHLGAFDIAYAQAVYDAYGASAAQCKRVKERRDDARHHHKKRHHRHN